jgi:hypothetical protein
MARQSFLMLALGVFALAPRSHYAFTPIHPTHPTTATPLAAKNIDVSGRNVDINDVMDETEAALRAAEESLASPPPPKEKEAPKELDLDIDELLGEAEDALQAAEEALQQPKPKVVQDALQKKQEQQPPPPPKNKPMNYMPKKRLSKPLVPEELQLTMERLEAAGDALQKQQQQQTPDKPQERQLTLTMERLEEMRAQALIRYKSGQRPLIPDQDLTVEQLLQVAPPIEEPAVNVPTAVALPPRTPNEEQEILASTLGGIVTGIVLGVAAFQVVPDLDMYIDYSIPPIIASVVFGIAYYTSASIEGSNGAFVRSIVGKPMQAIGNGILGTIAAIGNAMTSAAQRQVDKATNDIKAIPGRAADDIKAIPGRAADAASRQATKVVQDMKATPGRVAEDTKRKFTETVDSVKKRVLPKKNKRGEEE